MPARVKLKGIDGARTSGGACGLIRYTRETLPGLDIYGNVQEIVQSALQTGKQVLHGCRQLVS